MGFLQNWGSIFAQNFRATNHMIGFDSGPRVAFLCVVTLTYFVFVWSVVPTQEFAMELTLRAAAALAYLALYPAFFLARVPVTIHRREQALSSKLGDIIEKLTPKLVVSAAAEGAPMEVPYGSKVTTQAGQTISSVVGHNQIFRLRVDNTGDHSTDITEAEMVSLRSNTGKHMDQPLRLTWAPGPEGEAPDYVIIAPRTGRYVDLMQALPDQVGFCTSNASLELMDVLADGTEFVGTVMINDRYFVGVEVEFRIRLQPTPVLQILKNVPAQPAVCLRSIEEVIFER